MINSIPKVTDRRARAAHDARPPAALFLPGPIITFKLQILAKCPTCDAGLPIRGDEEAVAISAERCGRDIPIKISEALRLDRAVDRCPVCDGADFYGRKDFDPTIGLTVVIAGALVSGVFYWFGRDLIAYSILAGAALIDLFVYGRLKDLTVCYRCHTRIPRRVSADGAGVRSAHRGRPRAGVREADREKVNRVIG